MDFVVDIHDYESRCKGFLVICAQKKMDKLQSKEIHGSQHHMVSFDFLPCIKLYCRQCEELLSIYLISRTFMMLLIVKRKLLEYLDFCFVSISIKVFFLMLVVIY